MERSANTPVGLKSLTNLYLILAEEALLSEQFEAADRAAGASAAIAKKLKEIRLIDQAESKKKEIAQEKAKAAKLKKARETLAAKPQHEGANLLVGQFECFVKGNWAAGLPLLAMANEGALKELAQKDLAAPIDASTQLSVADGWWDLAEKESGRRRENLRDRARHYYEKAASSATGLAKARSDNRLLELRLEKFKGTWVDVSDSKSFVASNGSVSFPIKVGQGALQQVMLQKFPEGEFDAFSLRVRFGDEIAGPLVQYDYNRSGFALDSKGERVMTCKSDGKGWDNGLVVGWPRRPECLVTVVLREGACIFFVDGIEMIRDKTALVKITSLAVQCDRGSATIDQIRMRKKE